MERRYSNWGKFIVLMLILGLSLLSGCSGKEGKTASAPSEQVTSPQTESVQEQPAPSPPEAVPTTEKIPQPDAKTEARVDEFMGKLEQSLELTEEQKGEIRDLMYDYFTQMAEAQRTFAGSGGRPDPSKLSNEEREKFMKAREERQNRQAEFTSKIKEILSPDQFDKFQKLWAELRQEMIVQQTIEQIGSPGPAAGSETNSK